MSVSKTVSNLIDDPTCQSKSAIKPWKKKIPNKKTNQMVQRIFFYFPGLGTQKNNTWVSMSNGISMRTYGGHYSTMHRNMRKKMRKKMNRYLWQFLILFNDYYANIMNRSLSNGNNSLFDPRLKVYANSLLGPGKRNRQFSLGYTSTNKSFTIIIIESEAREYEICKHFFRTLVFELYCPELVSFIEPSCIFIFYLSLIVPIEP